MTEDKLREELRQTLQKFVQQQYRSTLILQSRMDGIIPTARATIPNQDRVDEIIKSEVEKANQRLAFFQEFLSTPAQNERMPQGMVH